MELPEDLKYSREHEWVARDGDVARVGITDYAQDALGDVVYVQLPTIDAAVTAHGSCAEIESTKSVSEVFTPISGRVVEVNDALTATPELVNQEPYRGGWIFAVQMSDPAELDELLDAAAYRTFLESE